MSRPAPRPLSLAVDGLARALAPATTLARVQEVWERAAGPAVAGAAAPTGEREGLLTVTCSASVWAQELDLMAGELIPRINQALGADLITDLRCRTG
jgi:predicted nucleic acid-binding Zn ribbon protein